MSEDDDLKVTDRRMFTRDGELREEYRHLEREPSAPAPGSAVGQESEVAVPPAGDAGPGAPPPPSPEPQPPPRPAAAAPAPPPLEIPGTPPELGAPSFVDLVSVLAEPAAMYLGDIELPDGRSAENLDMARLHIDLLDVLRQKTVGSLTSQESAILEDVLYRLRLRYVQKRG